MKKEKTLEDLIILINKTKMKYQQDKMNYNWNYKFTQETIDNGIYFMIANYHKATRIIFDDEQKIITEKTMYTMDVRTMTELQNQLKEEQK